jgi:hypothetical protein
MVIRIDPKRQWPAILGRGEAASECFQEIPLPGSSAGEGSETTTLAQIRVYRIVCP